VRRVRAGTTNVGGFAAHFNVLHTALFTSTHRRARIPVKVSASGMQKLMHLIGVLQRRAGRIENDMDKNKVPL